MKQKMIIAIITVLCSYTAQSQQIGLFSNAFALGTGTINFGVETKLTERITIEAIGCYNPIPLMNFSAIQPTVNYYFNRTFWGLYAFGGTSHAYFNIKGEERRYKGWMNGFGVGIGYVIPIKQHINLSFAAGIGLYHTSYRDSPHHTDYWEDEIIYHRSRWYVLPSKAEVRLTFLF